MTAVPVCVCDDHFMEFAKEPAGRVHSVYEKAVNIWDGRHLFAIVSGRDFAAPYTANVEGINFLSYTISPGDRVGGMFPNVLFSGKFAVNCEGAQRFCGAGRYPAAEFQVLADGIAQYKGYLQRQDILKGCAGFFRRYFCGEVLPEPGCLTSALNERLRVFVENAWEPELFAAGARKLLGAGQGLTPSGDDFLCGILAALNSGGAAGDALLLALTGCLGECLEPGITTDVSRQMLTAAISGEFSQLNHKLACCFLKGGLEMELMMKQMETVGHSSGIDFSAGLAAGYCLIKNGW